MKFTTELAIRFAHCDLAGIVFYPRYFEMINGVVEDWCAQGLGWSFHEMHMQRGIGLPTVHIDTDFVKVSELGEVLTAELSVVKSGLTSLGVQILLYGPQQDVRVNAKLVLVLIDLKLRKAIAIPDQLRAVVQEYMEPA